MADIFGAFSKGYSEGRNNKRQRQQDEVDNLVKYAQLAESGYKVRQQPSGRLFGGSQMVLEQDPSFQSLKSLQRQKLADDLEMNNYKLNAMRKSFGGGANATPAGQSSQEDWVMSPDGRFVANPNKPKPLNELDLLKKAALEKKQAEAEAADQTKEENLINSANENLLAIQEAKKGKKYFGMMGKLPSSMAPSTYLQGEYGQRKNWENNINKVTSGQVLEVMNKMKAASKTGATGFGALNEKELAILQGASTALSRDLAPEDAMRYLNDIETMQKRVLARGRKFGQVAQQKVSDPNDFSAMSDDELRRLAGV